MQTTNIPVIPGAGGLPRLLIETDLAQTEIYPHGAHVTRWQPRDQAPVLWVSDKAVFAEGSPIRGGVPVCWPWFGPHPTNPAGKAHGFARTSSWTLRTATQSGDGSAHVALTLADNAATRTLWPHEFMLELAIDIGATLTLALTTRNTGSAPFAISEALHTYLSVADIAQTRVRGLQGARYLDQLTGAQLPQEQLLTTFSAETDRVYHTQAGCALTDPLLRREIHVAKRGSDSTVVWNPWIAKAARMADFGDDEWPGMLCIEAANAPGAPVTIAPGESHTLGTTLSVNGT